MKAFHLKEDKQINSQFLLTEASNFLKSVPYPTQFSLESVLIRIVNCITLHNISNTNLQFAQLKKLHHFQCTTRAYELTRSGK